MYCRNCGKEIDEKDAFCSHCGFATSEKKAENVQESKPVESKNFEQNSNLELGKVAFVFMIISCVMLGIYFIPLCWTIPMTVSLNNKLKNNEPISISFKICTLLFCSLVAGILLLLMKDNESL